MIEISCQSCGQKAGVQSFLAAAQQPCRKCGQLLMGSLSSAARTYRSAGSEEPAAPAWQEHSPGSSSSMWLGMLIGMFAGIGVVIGIDYAGPSLTLQSRGFLLGGLAGVLLAPILAISSFLSMLVLPFSLEGVLGGSVWERLARANNERSLRPLLWPFMYLAGLPMLLCAIGGARIAANHVSAMTVTAGLGAALLGSLFGAICGSIAGKGSRNNPASPVA